MRTHRSIGIACALIASGLLAGCRVSGKPAPGPEVPRPEAVMSFDQLYGENCAGCHGDNGRNGQAAELANPVYQAIVDDTSLKDIITNGEKGTLMPGFGISGGGTLTDAQIDVLIKGMRSKWSKTDALGGATAPSWHGAGPGDTTKGAAVYTESCARCHGADAAHPGQAGSILDGSFLGLINEQMVRTTIIAGRDDIGQPDWRNLVAGRALTEAEITDVSAWLIAQRPPFPGRPYATPQQAAGSQSNATTTPH